MTMIGTKKRSTPNDIVELLLECHGRIRGFAAMAVRLGEATDAPESEVLDAARSVRRYFTEALPLHVLDEAHTVEPRLRGRDAQLDVALDRMEAEHHGHRRALATLVSICRDIEFEPRRHPELRELLLAIAVDLRDEFERHLEHEEAVILPALRMWLTTPERAQMLVELRERRETAMTAPRPVPIHE